jgi:hypothetical protein
VFGVGTARVNVYLPDELAVAAGRVQFAVSALTQSAIKVALAQEKSDIWLGRLLRSQLRSVLLGPPCVAPHIWMTKRPPPWDGWDGQEISLITMLKEYRND